MVTKTTVQNIVKAASDRVAEMGGGEQFIGHLQLLAESCGADDTTNFMVDLGEALEKVGLQLTFGPGEPDTLYASKAR
jgi:hypothetical protein